MSFRMLVINFFCARSFILIPALSFFSEFICVYLLGSLTLMITGLLCAWWFEAVCSHFKYLLLNARELEAHAPGLYWRVSWWQASLTVGSPPNARKAFLWAHSVSPGKYCLVAYLERHMSGSRILRAWWREAGSGGLWYVGFHSARK